MRLSRSLTQWIVLTLALSGTIVSSALPTFGATATSTAKKRQADIANQVGALRQEVAHASAEESALLERLDAITGHREAVDAQIAALDAHINEVQRQIDAAEARLHSADLALIEGQAKLKLTRDKLRRSHDRLTAQVTDAYIHNMSTSAVDAVVNAQDLNEIPIATYYANEIASQQQSIVEAHKKLKDQATLLSFRLKIKRDDVKRERNVVARQRAGLEADRKTQADLRWQALDQAAQQEALLNEVRGRRAEFQAQIMSLQAESGSLTAQLRGIQSGQGPTPSGRGVLSLPIANVRITSTFGPRTHPIFGDPRVHTGIDFGAPSGLPIRAAADGTVVSAGVRGGYGNATVIDHGNSLATLYAHQSSISVAAGTHVRRGQVIGYVGSTGNSTGPHLHFEVRVQGVPVDPMNYL